MENKLEVIVSQSGLDQTKADYILNRFKNYFEQAAYWECRAKDIIVTHASQIEMMEQARNGRLQLKEKRLAIEKSRKELKEQSLREGKAIDGIANVLKALIEPIEDYLDQQEHFVEYRKKAEEDALRKEVEARMELERQAREKAELEERHRLRKENAALQEKIADEQKQKEIEQKKVVELGSKLVEISTAKVMSEARANAAIAARRIAEKELAEMIECPHCHKKFKLGDCK